MIIAESAIGMAAKYTKEAYTLTHERLFFKDSPNRFAAQEQRSYGDSASDAVDSKDALLQKLNEPVDLSRAGAVLAQNRLNQMLDFTSQRDPKAELNLQILMATLKSVMGKSINLVVPQMSADAAPIAFSTAMPQPTSGAAPREFVYQRTQVVHESETLDFAATGRVTTKDGKTIEFDISLSMAREFKQITSSQMNIFTQAPTQLVDPLVINFDGLGAELLSEKIHFDLDMDGAADQISRLKSNSGYLVWDKNADGAVNDGSELFGPSTGKGFAELAEHDLDNNGFIDESDPIFSQLRIWVQYENGTSQLLALAEKDVGAIYVGHASTPFSMKDSLGQSHGEIANTGIYLKESGGAGLVQEVYLAK